MAKSVEASAAGAQKTHDYVEAFARVLTQFTELDADEVLAQIPRLLVTEFGADRAELWLWEVETSSAYLVHHDGKAGAAPREFAQAKKTAIGSVGSSGKPIEDAALDEMGAHEQKFARDSGLLRITAYPLPTQHTLAVLAIYSRESPAEQTKIAWRSYAELCGIKVRDIITEREQQKQITQLSLLFEATRLLNSTLDLAELLELILKIARNEVGADRGSVFLVDQKSNELWSIVASGLDHQEIRVPFGRGVSGYVAVTGEIVNVEDAYSFKHFDQSYDQKFGYRTRSLLSMPICHRSGEIVGVLQLLNKANATKFSDEDVDFLCKLSAHMAMALENARLHRESLEKQRMEKELALARQIQHSLLPEAPPVVPGFDLSVANEPCFECGGDYYDFIPLGPHTLLLVVADVEGKGVASALVMSNLQATLRALVMHLHSLEVLTFSLNEMIYNDTKRGKYLSCFLGLVDTRKNGLHYINCGHVPPILISGKTGEHRELTDGGMVIGLFPHAEYKRGIVMLEPGDVFVACTDGIEEASDPANVDAEYGTERLAACVARHRHLSAREIVREVLAEVNAFCKGSKADDKVLMIMKVAPDGSVMPATSRPTE